jgi:hypothetical protein
MKRKYFSQALGLAVGLICTLQITVAIEIVVPEQFKAQVEAAKAAERAERARQLEGVAQDASETGAIEIADPTAPARSEPAGPAAASDDFVMQSVVEAESTAAAFEGTLAADEGLVSGQVLDQESGAPVPGAAIIIEGTDVATVTAEDGRYSLGPIAAGQYTLSFIKSGYIEANVTDYNIAGGQISVFPFALPPRPAEMSDEVYELQDFSVTAEEANDMMMKLDLKFDSDRALDIFSAEDFSRFAASDVSDAVKRIAGVSVNEGKFPSVRGLNDRYTVTTMNGMPIPSPDPFRKSPQFDLFPSSLLSSIVVSKSATADLAGESTAANFDLLTRSLPEEEFLSVSLSSGLNENAAEDFRTFDTPGNLLLIDSLNNFSEAPRESFDSINVRPGFDPTTEFLSRPASSKVDLSGSVAYGNTFEFESGGKFGVVAAAYHKRSRKAELDGTLVEQRDFESADILVPDLDPTVFGGTGGSYALLDAPGGNFVGLVPVASYVPVNGVAPVNGVDPLLYGETLERAPYGDETTFEYSEFTEELLMGGLLGLAYEFNEDNTVSVNLFHARTSESFVGYGTNGANPGEGVSGEDLFVERQVLYYNERKLTTFQLAGEHKFNQWLFEPVIRWGFQKASTSQDEPDSRDTVRLLDRNGNRRVIAADNFPLSSRSWRFVSEDENYRFIDAEFFVNEKTSLDAGFAYADASRESEVQTYFERRTDQLSTGDVIGLNGLPVFNDSNKGLGVFQFSAADALRSQSEGNREIQASYLALRRDVTDQIRMNLGVRKETSTIAVDSDVRLDSATTLADLFRGLDSAQKDDPGDPPQIGTDAILANQADILGVPNDFENVPGSKINRDLDDDLFLPSIILTLDPADALTIKLGYYETINRPSFREITGDIFVDSRTGDRLGGNPFLTSSTATNLDVRIEIRPARSNWELPFFENFLVDGDMLGVSLFKKEIENPIEFLRPSAQSIDELPFNNSEGAEANGIELEFVKSLAFLQMPYTEYFSFGGNMAWTDATAGVSEAERDLLGLNQNIDGALVPDRRALTEQPDQTMNLNLTFDQPDWGLTATLAYNFKSEILESIGSESSFDTYVGEQDTLDLILSKSFRNGLSINLSIKNLLNEGEERYFRNRAPDFSNPDIVNLPNPESFGDDLLRYSVDSTGISYSLGISYEF